MSFGGQRSAFSLLSILGWPHAPCVKWVAGVGSNGHAQLLFRLYSFGVIKPHV